MHFFAPRYRGPVSDHFDGRRFHNAEPAARVHGLGGVLRWMATRQRGVWRRWTESPAGPAPPREVRDLRVTFINHATVLIQIDGRNILTDPVWSERVSPVSFAGPRRVRPPGIRFEDLPPIHVVLVSHNHYDHLDLATLDRLARRDRPRIFIGLGAGAILTRRSIGGVTELEWWQKVELGAGSPSPPRRSSIFPAAR